MRANAPLSVLVTATVMLGCGGATPRPPARSVPVAEKAPPSPKPARWVFTTHRGYDLSCKLDLGDGRVLYAGKSGRRVLTHGDDLEDAPDLALADLVGIVRDARGGFGFVASDGSVYRASDPLGPLGAPQPGPLAAEPNGKRSVRSVGTGRAAAVAVLSDGTVMRTPDLGRTWTPVEYAGANKPFGSASSVALDPEGNGVLVHLPQRLFVSHDDGATWAPIASPANVGASFARRGDNDRVHVLGYHDFAAVLDGNAFRRVSAVHEMPFPATLHPQPHRPPEGVTLLAGDHVVHLQQHGDVRPDGTLNVVVTSAKLGERPGHPTSARELAGWVLPSASLRAAAYGSSLLYLRNNTDATSSVLTSDDFGATWHESATLPGLVAGDDPGLLALGPRGWALVPSLCMNPFDSTSCTAAQIRPAGAAAFQPLASPEPFRVTALAPDAAHNRVFALGTHEGRQHVYVSPLTGSSFSRTDILDAPADAATRIAVDPSGTLRVMTYDRPSEAWVLRRAGLDGKAQPPLFVSLEGDLALVGLRGLLMSQDRAYETADGGETWMRVATNTYFMGALMCSEEGCVTEDAQRVGWDMPAVQAGPKVRADVKLTRPARGGSPSPQATPMPKHVGITCKPTGGASSLSSFPTVIDARGGTIRWASFERGADGRVDTVVADGGRVRDLPLLGPEVKPKGGGFVHTDVRSYRAGVVAARALSSAPRAGTPRSADFDLAWWSAATDRVEHHRISNVTPFDVTSYGIHAWLVSGGLLFQATSEGTAYFVHDDGKVDPLAIPIPGGSGIDEVARYGHRWFTTNDSFDAVHFAWSNDDGKTWEQGAWGLGRQGGPDLEMLGGEPAIVWSETGQGTLVFHVDAPPPNDPPTPTVLPDSAQLGPPCDAAGARAQSPGDLLSTRGGAGQPETELEPDGAIQRLVTVNGRCTVAHLFHHVDRSSEKYVVLHPAGTGWQVTSAWRTTSGGNFTHGTYTVEPLTCTPQN